jgi:hypothetical protein
MKHSKGSFNYVYHTRVRGAGFPMSLSAGRGNVKCQQEQEEVRVEKGRQFILFFLNGIVRYF